MFLRIAGGCLAAALVLAPAGRAQTGPAPLAVIAGEAITEREVREEAATEFQNLENERLRFEANHRSREHQVMEDTLGRMIGERLLEAEAAKQGLTPQQLLEAEVEAKMAGPSDAEVQSIYDMNRGRLAGVGMEAGLEQVRVFLNQRNYDQAYDAYVDSLREAYDVDYRLEPYRVDVETEGHPVHGPADAPVTLVEFSDFECPFCRQTVPVLDRIEAEFGDRVRVVYRQFPLNDIHPRAQKAAEASLCAEEQGRFWELHDLMFAQPVELEVASLKAKAATLDLDTEAFNACLDSSRYAARVRADIQAGVRAGVTGTPMIYINGRPVSGAQPFETYAAIIEDELERNSPSDE